MDKAVVSQFEKLFNLQLKSLQYSQEVVNPQFHLNGDDLMDELDMTSSELEQSMRIRLRNREALFAKKIQEALARIKDGSFGTCEQCEEDIELRRLEARPTTTLCVNCKEEQEQREHHHIDGRKHKSVGVKASLKLLA